MLGATRGNQRSKYPSRFHRFRGTPRGGRLIVPMQTLAMLARLANLKCLYLDSSFHLETSKFRFYPSPGTTVASPNCVKMAGPRVVLVFGKP